jgi:hypothetical protein
MAVAATYLEVAQRVATDELDVRGMRPVGGSQRLGRRVVGQRLDRVWVHIGQIDQVAAAEIPDRGGVQMGGGIGEHIAESTEPIQRVLAAITCQRLTLRQCSDRVVPGAAYRCDEAHFAQRQVGGRELDRQSGGCRTRSTWRCRRW